MNKISKFILKSYFGILIDGFKLTLSKNSGYLPKHIIFTSLKNNMYKAALAFVKTKILDKLV